MGVEDDTARGSGQGSASSGVPLTFAEKQKGKCKVAKRKGPPQRQTAFGFFHQSHALGVHKMQESSAKLLQRPGSRIQNS
eukprot:6492710-Amphidinium_carterae.1